jgi:hypothetical protein
MKIPRLPIKPDATENEKRSITHFNALMDELKWYFENGVRVSIKWKSTGYEMVFSAVPKSKIAKSKI